jgi:hypothetical protein
MAFAAQVLILMVVILLTRSIGLEEIERFQDDQERQEEKATSAQKDLKTSARS